jgi:dCTP diphosphatase
VLGIDLIAAANAKISINAKKYPAHKVRGKHQKYTEYED